MKATLKNFKQSPRKVSLVARSLRGKQVKQALETLRLVNKKSSDPLRKLILSAVNNAGESGVENIDTLLIREVRVDQGMLLKRWRPRAFGRATLIRRRSSTIHIELQ